MPRRRPRTSRLGRTSQTTPRQEAMMNKNSTARAASVVPAILASAFLAGTAFADTITFSQGVSTPTTPDWNSILSLHQFDPSLGTLTGVRATVSGTITGTMYEENFLSQPITGFYSN